MPIALLSASASALASFSRTNFGVGVDHATRERVAPLHLPRHEGVVEVVRRHVPERPARSLRVVPLDVVVDHLLHLPIPLVVEPEVREELLLDPAVQRLVHGVVRGLARARARADDAALCG